MSLIILPGDPNFEETLMTPSPDYLDAAERDGDSYAFVVGNDGLARPVTSWELTEYLEGGEYNERLTQIGDVIDEGGE
jgi:hypothetical protein